MIKALTDFLLFNLLALPQDLSWVQALHFFIYDVTKITLLLMIIIFLMGIVNSYFPVDKVRSFLSRKKLYGFEHFLASVLGAVTPFCSCSSIPLFIGFLKGGIPLGVTLSFLITSPLVNEVALALFVGFFGIKITIMYATAGILLGTVIGYLLGKLGLEHLLMDWVKKAVEKRVYDLDMRGKRTFKDRLPEIYTETRTIFKRVFPYVVIGIFVGALIHGYVPVGYFESYLGTHNIFAVPFATIIAVPMYANASGIIPVVQSLISKGIPIGTALSFMMAVIGLSLPEAMLLKQVMTLKLITIYFGTVACAIMVIGYLFNMILY